MENHWLADKDYSTKNKKMLSKFFTRSALILLLGFFLFVSFLNPSTGAHTLADGNAEREQTSFIELGYGCVASTEWIGHSDYEPNATLLSGSFYSDALLPLYSDYDLDGEISAEEVNEFFASEADLLESFGIENNLYSKDWTSMPPVWGDYAATPWEGARIQVNYNSYLPRLNGMGFADGLGKLYEGAYVVWYHPRLTDVTQSYILEKLESYIGDKVVNEKTNFYLQPLPISESEFNLFSRNIYYTKLGFTQSCLEFNANVFREFYN